METGSDDGTALDPVLSEFIGLADQYIGPVRESVIPLSWAGRAIERWHEWAAGDD